MIVECQNCGAPLDVKDSAVLVVCRYCDKTNRVRSMKTIATQRPAQWTPPSVWTPPAHVRASSSRQLRLHRPVWPRLAGCLGPLLALTIGGGAAIPALLRSGAIDLGTLPSWAAGWDGKRPFVCGGNDTVTISGVVADLPGEIAVEAQGNCDLTLEDVTLRARVGVRAGGNRRVVLRRCRIEATEVGVELDGNRQLVAIDSHVSAGGVGVSGDANATLELTGGQVSGAPTAVRVRSNSTVRVAGTVLIDGAAAMAGTPSPSPAEAAPDDKGVTVTGPLAAATVRSVIARHAATLERCARSVSRRAAADAVMVVGFEITTAGRVRSFEVVSTDVSDRETERCVERAFGRMRFPRPGGAPVQVRYRLPLVP